MTLIDRYKLLPDSCRIPDVVWSIQKIQDQLARLDADRDALRDDLVALWPTMMRELRSHWSIEELQAAGLMSGDIPKVTSSPRRQNC